MSLGFGKFVGVKTDVPHLLFTMTGMTIWTYFSFVMSNAGSSIIIFAPIFIPFGMIAALSVGIWLSALTVRYQDFQQVVPFMVQIGLYITPIAHPADFAMQQLPK